MGAPGIPGTEDLDGLGDLDFQDAQVEDLIRDSYDQARNLASAEIRRLVGLALCENPELSMFAQVGGRYQFFRGRWMEPVDCTRSRPRRDLAMFLERWQTRLNLADLDIQVAVGRPENGLDADCRTNQ